jgi:hypothetical protein
MINESVLQSVVVSLAVENKKQYLMLSAVLNELAALRETVRALDPTFADVLEIEQKRAADSTREAVLLQAALLDDVIRKAGVGLLL